MKTPTIKEIASLLKGLKRHIDADCRAYEDSETPSILVTVGCDSQGSWSYQTGDTSFIGGAYGFPYWGQTALERRSNCLELARDIIEELKDAQTMDADDAKEHIL